jgi:phosphate/sulfate permease
MENLYFILVGILFILAISDLIVGVSNDAVNFLNSAIGSKVAPRYIIMIIASVGILIGTTFSSGMMEIARKGVFHPDQFFFAEIMIIFLAVMLTDVMLLDTFNTFGLPTSTTVSIVFELLGAAVAVSIIKISRIDDATLADLNTYINSGKALMIIAGILLSVVFAFTIGSVVQFFARLFFSFNFDKTFKYYGSLWGGIAITAITYFILIKGAKGSAFVNDEAMSFIKHNTFQIILYSFIGWTILLQLLHWTFKLNILKAIVLVGTFALAMAFAGNDLVNYIGVPLAGLKSFQEYAASGVPDDQLLMTALQGSVKSNTYLLLIAGLIMVITLWLSKKARSVTDTEINLSRQSDGAERFGSSMLSRTLVRSAMDMSRGFNKVMPKGLNRFIEKRFDATPYEEKLKGQKEAPSFDLVRASVNLTVASVIISFATSLKLPLSTTYVTFMVAMGSSLADKAWGRESAVYRITGVITVIGGWFFTAFVAFTAAFLIAVAISYGGNIAILLLVLVAFFFVVKTHALHKKRTSEKAKRDLLLAEEVGEQTIRTKCTSQVNSMLDTVIKVFNETLLGLANEDRKSLKNVCGQVEKLNTEAKYLKNNVHFTLAKLPEGLEIGHYYVQVIDYLREMAHSLTFISNPAYEHIDNNHKGLIEEQVQELNEYKKDITLLFSLVVHAIENDKYDDMDEIIEKQQEILTNLKLGRKKQIKRIKNKDTGTKNSILYLGLLNEIKNLVLQTINVVKSQRDFSLENTK